MSEIVKSMRDALIDLETKAENFDTDLQDDEVKKSVTFDLEKSEDADFSDEYVDVSPFIREIVELNDRNTARLARATEASLNFSKSLGGAIEALAERVDALFSTVEKMASAPMPSSGAVSKSQADELLKAVQPRQFGSVEESAQASAGLATDIKAGIVGEIRKAWKASEGFEHDELGKDLVRISAAGSANGVQILSALSDSGKRVAKEFIDNLAAAEKAAE